MEKVVIKNIKRKTTLPRSEMKKAVDYAYSIKLPKDLHLTYRLESFLLNDFLQKKSWRISYKIQ